MREKVVSLMAKQKGKKETPSPEYVHEERTRYPVTAADFVLCWNTSESADEVAEKLHMPKPIVQARVSNYRKRGIVMKKMRRKNARRVDVNLMNQMLEELANFQDIDASSVEKIQTLINKLQERLRKK